MRVRLGDFVLDRTQRVLLRGGAEVALEPKVFDCLDLLVSEAGKLVSMERLRAGLWPGVHVGEGALRRIINELRKALGDTGSAQAMIRTRKGLGYVFVGEVTPEPAARRSVAPEAPPAWPFVGRERELKALRDFLASADGGRLCFVSGEAGAGKSSLLARIEAERPAEGRWLSGHCQATLGLPAFWPFRQLAARMLEDPLLRSRAQLLAASAPGVLQAWPELAGAGGALRAPEVASAEARFALCEGFAALLRALSRECPLWLAIEDVHWADDGSVALLEAIARAAAGHPLYVFATYRPEAVAPGSALSQLIGRTSGRGGVFSLHLEALKLAELQALLESVKLPGATHAAHALLQQTSGNALFVHELVRHALATDTPLDSALPPSLAYIVAERVGLLPQATQLRLGQAAVLGHDFALAALAAIAGSSSTELLAELEPALRAGLLQRSARQPDRLRFSHALVGDALAQRLSLHERRAYHCAALRALSALPGGAESGELAVHAFEAGDDVPVEERRRLCEDAGRAAFEALAFDRAALQLGRALELVPPDEGGAAAAELALLWAKARWLADDPERDVEAAFLQAAERARRAGSAALLAEAAIGFAVGDESSLTLRIVSLRPEALALAEEAWQALLRDAPAGLDGLRGELPYRLAATLCWMRAEAGDPAEFQRAARLALQLAPARLEGWQRLWLLALQAAAEPERACALMDEILERVRDPEIHPRRGIEILSVGMGSRLLHGDLAGHERTAAEVARLAERLPPPSRVGRAGERHSMYIGLPLCAPVTLSMIRGEFRQAEQQLIALSERIQRVGFARSRESDHNGFHMLLQLAGYLGRSKELEPLIELNLRTNPETYWFAALAKAQFALERGEPAAAAGHFAVLRESGFRPTLNGRALLLKPETLVRLADVCAAVGTAADAALLYAELLPHARGFVHDGALISWGSCGRPLGELAFQLGRTEEAERHFADALAMNERIGHRPEHVRTRLGFARLLLATGRAEQARALIDSARRDAAQMGMASMVELAERLASL